MHIIKHAIVSKIEIENNKAVGVRFTYNGQDEMFAINRKYGILSAGTVGSARILMFSGIGPRKHLDQLRIPVKKDLCVGKNLHDHVQVPLLFEFPLTDERDTTEKLDELYQLAFHNSGPLTRVGITKLIGHLSIINDTRYPYYQVQFTHLRRGDSVTAGLLDSLPEPTKYAMRKKINERDIVVVKVVLFNQKSQSISEQPRIDFNFLDQHEDVESSKLR